jgi:serine protease Do
MDQLVKAKGSTKPSSGFKWLVALPLMAVLVFQTAPVTARSAPESFADLVEKLLPAVVNISTTQKISRKSGHGGQGFPDFELPPGSPFKDFFDQFKKRRKDAPEQSEKATSLGSGFIIDKSGLVVTNNHVIDGADQITVILKDKRRFEAVVVGKDEKTDLALLRVKSKKPLPFLEWGESRKARVGDWVLAIGNPLGLGGSVTAGIVSARGRDIRSGPYDDFIQTDAPINRGNSGGPLFDMHGRVVGINTAILSPNGGSIGIGFSIPSELAKRVIAQLQKFGVTKRGWLGVQIQTVSKDIAESLGLDEAYGALVAGIVKASPAARAGFKSGDVILKFDGRRVEESRRLPRMVAETDVGKKVEVLVWRNKRNERLYVQLGELEKVDQVSLGGGKRAPEGDAREFDELGLSLAPITDSLAKRFKLNENVEGVVVAAIKPDGAAAEKGLRAGTVIVEVNQVKVKTPREFAKELKKASKANQKSVLLLINEGGEFRFIGLKLGKK